MPKGRSINLAMSNRARRSLRAVGLEEEILKCAIPMEGRLLHGLSGGTKSVKYDNRTQQCIYSVGRNFLNSVLLNACEKYENVKLHFLCKLIGVDCSSGIATIEE